MRSGGVLLTDKGEGTAEWHGFLTQSHYWDFQSFLGSELIMGKKTDAKSILEVFPQYLEYLCYLQVTAINI